MPSIQTPLGSLELGTVNGLKGEERNYPSPSRHFGPHRIYEFDPHARKSIWTYVCECPTYRDAERVAYALAFQFKDREYRIIDVHESLEVVCKILPRVTNNGETTGQSEG